MMVRLSHPVEVSAPAAHDDRVPFKPGEGGRPKGTPNKTTTAVKAALTHAFEGLGGVPALMEWAKKDPAEFYKLWAKLLPHEIVGADGGEVTIRVVTGIEASPEKGE